jgi:hypothetical protein
MLNKKSTVRNIIFSLFHIIYKKYDDLITPYTKIKNKELSIIEKGIIIISFHINMSYIIRYIMNSVYDMRKICIVTGNDNNYYKKIVLFSDDKFKRRIITLKSSDLSILIKIKRLLESNAIVIVFIDGIENDGIKRKRFYFDIDNLNLGLNSGIIKLAYLLKFPICICYINFHKHSIEMTDVKYIFTEEDYYIFCNEVAKIFLENITNKTEYWLRLEELPLFIVYDNKKDTNIIFDCNCKLKKIGTLLIRKCNYFYFADFINGIYTEINRDLYNLLKKMKNKYIWIDNNNIYLEFFRKIYNSLDIYWR